MSTLGLNIGCSLNIFNISVSILRPSGSKKALETLETLMTTYRLRKTDVEHRTFSFKVETKPVAELTHLIYQQQLNGFTNVISS